MKIDNNTVAILGIIIVATIAVLSAIRVPNNEIATGLVALGSTAIGGVIGYLAKSQTFDNEFIAKTMADSLKNNGDIYSDEIISSDDIKKDNGVD